MGSFSIWHWLIVLAIVLLVFGTKRLTSERAGPGQGRQRVQERHDRRRGQARRPPRQRRRLGEDRAARARRRRPLSHAAPPMFDFSFGEMLVVAVVALVVLGPERLPKGGALRRPVVRKARAQWYSVKSELEQELASEGAQAQPAGQPPRAGGGRSRVPRHRQRGRTCPPGRRRRSRRGDQCRAGDRRPVRRASGCGGPRLRGGRASGPGRHAAWRTGWLMPATTSNAR